ncbi:hypothetical protein VaNZ11_009346 [Volvox africanus]|uniref:Uncharacterized protein n=1 Tax=Volvox africanus TaxID=51714 RepID=A0ABQ5S747_9CHLO|nr:hypothetical protein VaNZ11_009346 [Volvox africanus]
MIKEQTVPAYLRFQVSHSNDVSSVVPAQATTLIRGLYPKCVCFHPSKPLMAVGVSGYLAVYDLQTNTRLGRVDLRSVPVEMAFAPDGSIVIVIVQDWILYSVNILSWKTRQLVPRRAKMDKPLESCLLAVTPGNSPFIYFCRFAKDTLRLATLPSRGGVGAAEGPAGTGGPPGGPSGGSATSGRGGSSWGTRVKLDVQRAILSLACHHIDAQLLVLTADGQLRGYGIASGGGEVLAPIYAVQVQDPSDKLSLLGGVLSCVPHPALPTGAIILQGSRVGTVTVLEAPGRSAPTIVLRGRVPLHFSTIGMGICRTQNTLLVFGHSDGGRVRCTSWRLVYKAGTTGLTLRQSRVEPQDVTPFLDNGRRTKAALAVAMTSGALAASHAYVAGPGGGPLAMNAPAAATASALAASSQRHGLWSLTPAWAHDASSSCLLESQLGPSLNRVLVHQGLGLIVLVPDLPRAAQMNREVLFTGRGGLSGEELALARRTSTLVLMMIHNLEAHAAGWRAARMAQQHTPLNVWLPSYQREDEPGAVTAGDSSDDEPAATTVASPRQDDSATGAPGELALPPHVYYLAGSRLMKYALVPRTACTMVNLPPDTSDGDTRVARQLLHSSKAGAWLVFFEVGIANGAGGTGGGAPATSDRFNWSLVNASSFSTEGGAGFVTWTRAGKSGCFLGPNDTHFCVMSSNGKLLEIFDTAATSGATAGGTPLLTLTLEGASLLPGLGSPLFPGPPMTNAPVPEARAPPEAPPHDARRFRGLGVVMWQSSDMALSMTTLPALQRVPLDATAATQLPARAAAAAPADSSDSDSDGAQPVYPSMPVGHFFGPQQRQAHLPLMPQETVIHVAWQSLSLGPPSATATAAGATDAVAAVLTTQRLMLVTAGLRVVCSTSLATRGSAALLEPLTSVVWAGPMLLVSTAAGQVLQLTWTGSLLPVATLSPTGYMALMGVTADSLLVLRTPLVPPPMAVCAAGMNGNPASVAALAEVVARPVALLQPLLIGWVSLAATGLLSYSGNGAAAAKAVRPALRHAVVSYDAASFTPRGIWALIAAGAWDLAAAIVAHMPALDGPVRLAAAAAAGDWSEVSSTLLAEASRALHAPAPPPRNSELYHKLMAAGAGALFHGQLSTAGTLFQAAGEWPVAMILAVCQGSSQGLAAIVHKLAQPGGPATAILQTPEVQLAQNIASALRNVYGGVGTMVGDAELKVALPGSRPGTSEPVDRAENWAMAAPLAAPAAVAVPVGLPRGAVPDVDLGPIPPCPNRGTVVAAYGFTATAAASVAAANGGGTQFASSSSRPPAGAAAAASVTGSSSQRPGGGSTALGDLDAHSVDSGDTAQAAARAEFFNQFGGGGGGGSGFGRGPTNEFSSDEDDSDSEATGSLGGGGGGTQRRIKLQIRDSLAAGGGAAAGSLREAVSNIRVAPPGSVRSSIASTVGPLGEQQPAAAAPAPVQFPPGMSSAQLYAGGVAFMEAGDWRNAAAYFSRAMSVLQHEERAVLDEQSRRARLAFCAQYYAATRLLEAVGAGTGPREARLYRYLTGLTLDDKHSKALLQQAITRNRAVGNNRYAADQLTVLIAKVADSAPPEYLSQLQMEVEECDRQGGRNTSVPDDEKVTDWALLVTKAAEGLGPCKESVDALVLPILS